MLASSVLVGKITNAHVELGIERAQRAVEFEDRHMIKRNTIFGELVYYPFSRISRSWYSESGRGHIAAEQRRRREKLVSLGDDTAEYAKMITLTFDTIEDSWSASGRLRRFLTALRTHCWRMGKKPSYIWVAEPQRRMALHYHVVLVGCPYIDKAKISEWWGRGRKKIEACDKKRTAYYIAKYVNKQLGYGGQDALIRHIFHSASHQRHLGSSRDISKPDPHLPCWVRELADHLGGLEYIREWHEDKDADYCYAETSIGETFNWILSSVAYRVYHVTSTLLPCSETTT